ncbi:hypothetical protein CANARDRAFT_183782, partial [[Candida] arabinofermentans NRRL YB-2248]
MCHSAFHLNFGEQTNFIIGRNGSGKSAVLTGISVALGVKASETDRGNSLKGLIMHGKNVARAIVTFKNEGPEAYKPEEYGHKIIIERVLYISKPPSCNIKNEKGKIMSTKKQTIDEILDYFGITIANPMTILTQTEAKTFLAHSTDTGKFKYFMEGTRLQETFNNVKALQSDVKEINQKIRKDSEILTQAKEKLNSALEVWSNFTNSDEFRNQQKLLSGKRLWLEVDSKLQNIEQARTVLKERQQELEKCKLDIDSNSQKKSSNEENLETAKTQVVRLNEEFETINSEKESMKIELTKAQQNVKKVQARIQSLETEVVSDNKSLKETEDKIEIEKDRLQRNTGELFDKYDTAIKKQKEILNKMETDDYKMNEELETLKNKRQTSKQKFIEKITSIKKSISKLSDKLQELEGGSGKLDSYLEDKKNFETGIQLNLQQIQAYKEEEKKCILEYEDDKMKFSKLSTNLKSLENKINDQKSLIEQYETEIENSEEELRNLQSNAIEFNDDIEALINFTEVSMPPIIETLRDSAIKHCSREEAKIMPGDTIEKIDSEIEIIASRLDQIEKEVGINREEAKIQVIKERTNYNNILLKYDQSVQLHNKIASSLQARLENLTSTASLLIQEVNLVFESALKLRGFTGLIDFNFNLGKLTLKVSTKQTEKLRNVESFSGGEKSFAQIAFLLAIWKPMQSKVRGLDEFDVFMDQVNRRLALKLILQKVSENPKTQTIFITPLEITHIEGLDNDTVNIHEIHPPER